MFAYGPYQSIVSEIPSQPPVAFERPSYDFADSAPGEGRGVLAGAVRSALTGEPYVDTSDSINVCIPFANVSDKTVTVVEWVIGYENAIGDITQTETGFSSGTFSQDVLIKCGPASPAVVAFRRPITGSNDDLPAFRIGILAVRFSDGSIERF